MVDAINPVETIFETQVCRNHGDGIVPRLEKINHRDGHRRPMRADIIPLKIRVIGIDSISRDMTVRHVQLLLEGESTYVYTELSPASSIVRVRSCRYVV